MKQTLPILLGILLSSVTACQLSDTQNKTQNQAGAGVPVLSPEASLQTMQLEKGFTMEKVAAEPLLSTPVAMTFDDSGRIWAVEMSDYQPIEEGEEAYPLGKVVILSDEDTDGEMDTRKVFLDSLQMPRAICLVDSGVLVAEPPFLWYVPIVNDRPGTRVLVDSAYTLSNNPEGQTNGLLRAMDNWIYSAGFGSNKRYRRVNGHWITEPTFLRGQWGLTQDRYGHLFYNNNTHNLLGDYFLPGVSSGNTYQKKTAGFNEKIVPDDRVYPLIPTPGVNRGYREGILDSTTHKLVSFTAACGPLVYDGGLFPSAYTSNVFVCEPAAYLIKRNLIQNEGLRITGRQAYQGREFLSSSDERFRPVSLNLGPEGALYVVDMYRGVIQDALSITDYLKNYSLSHGLNNPVNCGRIYRIYPDHAQLHKITIPEDPDKLVPLLNHQNAWVRNKTQQKIVDRHLIQCVPALKKLLFGATNTYTRIQALWTLEGLSALQEVDLKEILAGKNPHLRIQGMAALGELLNKNNYRSYEPVIHDLCAQQDSLTAVYATYVNGRLLAFDPETAEQNWRQILTHHDGNAYVTAAIISGIAGQEDHFLQAYHRFPNLEKALTKVTHKKAQALGSKDMKALQKKYPEGYAIYSGTCQTCHGNDGMGIAFVAPPLNQSQWVNGDKMHLIPIVLYGLSGPVKVKDKVYKKPEISGEMPGFGNNKFSDTALAEVISFIRQAWRNNATAVSPEDIRVARAKYPDHEGAMTIEELVGSTEQ